jgi:tRNA pseudouridine(38-40) synthase
MSGLLGRLHARCTSVDVIMSLAYYGCRYSGYQSTTSRAGGGLGKLTVEDEARRAVNAAVIPRAGCVPTLACVATSSTGEPVLRQEEPISLLALSRTDTGVHARDQVCRFVLPLAYAAGAAGNPDSLRAAINGHLPPDIRCTRLRWARGSQVLLRQAVLGKQYSMYYCVGDFRATQALRPHTNHMRGLRGELPNIAAMRTAMAAFVGTHDFSDFANVRRETAMRSEKEMSRFLKRQRVASPLAADGEHHAPADGNVAVSTGGGNARVPTSAATDGKSDVSLPVTAAQSSAAAASSPTRGPIAAGGDGRPRRPRDDDRALPAGDDGDGSSDGGSGCAGDGSGAEGGNGGGGGKRGYFNTVRTVLTAELTLMRPSDCDFSLGTLADEEGSAAADTATETDAAYVVRLRFVGDGFLRRQVRRMAAAVVAVGKGTLQPGLPAAILAARDERAGVGAAGSNAGGVEGSPTAAPGAPALAVSEAELEAALALLNRVPAAGPSGLWLDRVLMPPGMWDEPDWTNNWDPLYLADHGLPQPAAAARAELEAAAAGCAGSK